MYDFFSVMDLSQKWNLYKVQVYANQLQWYTLQHMEYLKQFQHHIANNDLPSTVSLWQEYCLSDEVDTEELKQILIDLKGSSLRETFGCYVEQALILWETLPVGEGKDAVFRLIFDIQTTNEPNLAEIAINYLSNKYKDDPHFQQKLRLVGLRDKINFEGAISNFELLTHMKVGNFFIHTGGWGVGEVIDVSILREQISLQFDYVAGHKDLSFTNAFKTLIPISKDHFLARRFGDPENFEAFAKKNPVETIHLLLRDLGEKTAGEIKDELCDLVIPENEWARWWQTTRTRLKKDTLIEIPEHLRGAFRLRREEVTHEERLVKALEKSPNADTLIEMIYSFMRDFPGALKNEEFKSSLIKQLQDVLTHKEITESQEVQILFILQDLGHEKAKELGSVISKFSNLIDTVNRIHVLAYKKRLLIEIKKSKKEWSEVFANLLISIDQNPLRDYLLEELLNAGKEKEIKQILDELLSRPNLSPSAFLWYFQKIMTEEPCPYADQEGRERFLEAFFVLLHTIETVGTAKDVIKKMLNFLIGGRFANVRFIFQHSNIESVKEILLLSTKCQSLTDHDVKILHSLAEVVHPSLSKLRKEEGEEEEESVIWATAQGYKKVKERIEKIATVETVENAKEIEIARSHGDLRENSEYKFALEKKSRLQSELRFLSNQIKHMRILTQEDIDSSQVSIGTIVSLESEEGEQLMYTLLGPWDADPENNVLSFRSKVAQEMAGLSVGGECSIHNKNWKVTDIKSYL